MVLKLMIHYTGNIQLESYVYVEYTWLISLWIVCKMCFQRSCGMPILWPNYKSSFFKEMKENDLLWESALSTPYQQVHTTFNGETKNMVAFVQLIASNIVKLGKEQKTWLQGPWNKVGSKHDLVHKHGIKWHNIMFKLLYWEVSITSQKHWTSISYVTY